MVKCGFDVQADNPPKNQMPKIVFLMIPFISYDTLFQHYFQFLFNRWKTDVCVTALIADGTLCFPLSTTGDFVPENGFIFINGGTLALICVDSLCSAEGARLGRSVQFSDTGLYPAQADHAKHLDAAALGVPVIAAGIPTLMDSDEGADLVVTPRALDSVIAHGSALLAGAINRALQPRLSVAQLFWLAG